MSETGPIMNLGEATMKSGGNGSKFDFKHSRIGGNRNAKTRL
jgi:hypothetical protein